MMRAAREGEAVERLRRAHPPREVLPEGDPDWAEYADDGGRTQQDRHEDRLRLALCERRGPAISSRADEVSQTVRGTLVG